MYLYPSFKVCNQIFFKHFSFQDTYDQVFMFESHREKGTLYNIKQVFDHPPASNLQTQCRLVETDLSTATFIISFVFDFW
jgi:hypothetical protein